MAATLSGIIMFSKAVLPVHGSIVYDQDRSASLVNALVVGFGIGIVA